MKFEFAWNNAWRSSMLFHRGKSKSPVFNSVIEFQAVF